MDNNQYFFSNEEGSNDSNVNMIGGSALIEQQSTMMDPSKRIESALELSERKGDMTPIEAQRLKATQQKMQKSKEKGGPNAAGGTGGDESNAPVSNPTAAMPTISSKQSASSTEKGSNCKEEKQQIDRLLKEKINLETDYYNLIARHNRLINILTTYETQFREFNQEKKKFDTTLKKLEEILTTEDAQILKQEAETLIDKAAQKKSEFEVGEGTSGKTQQQPPPSTTTGPQPPPPNSGQPYAGPQPPTAGPPPPPPNAGPPTPPQPTAGQAPLTIPIIQPQTEKEIKASFGNAFEGIGKKTDSEKTQIVNNQSKAKSDEFGKSLTSILDSFRSKETFTKDDITLAVQGISAAIGTLFTVKNIMNKSGFGIGKIIKNIAGIDPIKMAKEAIPQIITKPELIPLAKKIFKGETAAAREPSIEEFVKAYIRSLEKKIEGEGEESAKGKVEGKVEGEGTAEDKKVTETVEGKGTVAKVEGKEGNGTEGKGTVAKEGKGQEAIETAEGKGQVQETTGTVEAQGTGAAKEEGKRKEDTGTPEKDEVQANGTEGTGAEVQGEVTNTTPLTPTPTAQETAKTKKNKDEDCANDDECEGELECKDEKCKPKDASGGSRRKKKTKRRRGRRSQRGSGRRKKSLKRSKTN